MLLSGHLRDGARLPECPGMEAAVAKAPGGWGSVAEGSSHRVVPVRAAEAAVRAVAAT